MIEAADQVLTVTTGRGARKSTGLLWQHISVERLFERLARHEIGSKDNAECIVPGALDLCPIPCRNHGRAQSVDCGGGELHRLDANMHSLSLLFVDLDGLDVDALMRAVATVEATGLVFACYSTPSYAPPAKANARFVFPLAAPVPAANWKRVWSQLVAATGLTGVDPSCCNPSRLYYLPTKPTEDAPTFVRQGGEHLLAEPAPLRLVPPGAAPHETLAALRAYVDYPDDIELVERIARGESFAEPGARHAALLRATLLLARVGARSIDVLIPSLRAMDIDEAEAERMFDGAPVDDPPEVEAHRALLEEQAGTDQAFARRFARLCGDRARYAQGVWYGWDGTRWAPTDDAPLQLAASLRESYEADHDALRARIAELQEQMRQAPAAVLATKLERLMKKEEKFYARVITPTQNAGPASSFLRVAAGLLSAETDAFDADPWALNCTNVIVDLRTGAERQHSPNDMCTKLAPVTYDPFARAPLFMQTLDQALPDVEVREFFQRCIGYALTGVVSEDLLFLLLGDGGNGKSTLLNAIEHALGDYAGPAPKSLLMQARVQQTYELADLRGKRLVHMMELSQREYMDSSRLKSVVGGDRIIAARKYENQLAFTTQAKVFMPCNAKPRLNDDDPGAWRRIALIEFPVAFLTDAVRDKRLAEQLKDEAPGILAWAVRGCLEWQRGGLRVPDVCRRVVEEYRHEENYVARFAEDRIERGDGSISSARLYDAYRDWSQHEGVQPLSNTAFTMKLKKLGFKPHRTASARMWLGIKGLIA